MQFKEIYFYVTDVISSRFTIFNVSKDFIISEILLGKLGMFGGIQYSLRSILRN